MCGRCSRMTPQIDRASSRVISTKSLSMSSDGSASSNTRDSTARRSSFGRRRGGGSTGSWIEISTWGRRVSILVSTSRLLAAKMSRRVSWFMTVIALSRRRPLTLRGLSRSGLRLQHEAQDVGVGLVLAQNALVALTKALQQPGCNRWAAAHSLLAVDHDRLDLAAVSKDEGPDGIGIRTSHQANIGWQGEV